MKLKAGKLSWMLVKTFSATESTKKMAKMQLKGLIGKIMLGECTVFSAKKEAGK